MNSPSEVSRKSIPDSDRALRTFSTVFSFSSSVVPPKDESVFTSGAGVAADFATVTVTGVALVHDSSLYEMFHEMEISPESPSGRVSFPPETSIVSSPITAERV